MKKLLTIFAIAIFFLIIKVSNANAQHNGCTTCGGPGVPVYTDPSTYRGGLISGAISGNGYIGSQFGSGNIHILLHNSNGPSPYDVVGATFLLNTNQPINVNLVNLDTDPNDIFSPIIGGPFNDFARSVTFSGPVLGKTFKFFDSPSGSTSDDWTEVIFIQNIPSGNSYYLWTFEANYQDQYVSVIYHRNNGLDGKVSNIQMQ